MIKPEYKHSELTSRIISCAMEVHRTLGNGFQEVVYQRALDVEMSLRNLRFGREVSMPVFYKGVQVGERRVDFLIEDAVCVELKAISKMENVHLAQGINYLEAFQLEIGLLINFGATSLEFKRLENKKLRHPMS